MPNFTTYSSSMSNGSPSASVNATIMLRSEERAVLVTWVWLARYAYSFVITPAGRFLGYTEIKLFALPLPSHID
jgi:hypothetical protein